MRTLIGLGVLVVAVLAAVSLAQNPPSPRPADGPAARPGAESPASPAGEQSQHPAGEASQRPAGEQSPRPAEQAATTRPGRNLGTTLMEGLKATPGCLGVDSAITRSGKNVIFAWFKDKKAVMAWYESETHNTAKRMFFPQDTPDYVPLAGVPDDAGPLLVIASMMTPKGDGDAASQLPHFSIDTLTPVTPGMATSAEGSFAPPEFRALFEARRGEGSGK